MTDFVICANSHSPDILDANLAKSPCLERVLLHVESHAPSASIGYNRAIDATDAPFIVFAHHDVYLPRGWDRLLAVRLAELQDLDPNWALYGTYGVGLDVSYWGPVWSSSIGQIAGRVPSAPVPVQSFDEMLIVMRRDAGLRFDEALPGWHLYGTDIVQTAKTRGRGAYAGGLPCIHNDGFHESLGRDFNDCYGFIRRKWATQLPIHTPVCKLADSGISLLRNKWRMWRSTRFRKQLSVSTEQDPEILAASCGWSDLTASAKNLSRQKQIE